MHNTFDAEIIPANEDQRLSALARYRLLDTPEENVFDNMTLLAAEISQTPVALISLVGAETVFFKSSVGVGKLKCVDRGESLCALTIMSTDLMVLEDTLLEPSVAGSAPIQHGVRFYAGAPLKTDDGFLIGTICVVDFSPRPFSAHERKVIASLARVIMEQVELRLKVINETEFQAHLLEKKDEFISVASHELKTPITSLTASLQLLDRMKAKPQPQLLDKMISQANKSLQKLNRLVGDLLNTSRITSGKLELRKNLFRPVELARDCCNHVRNEGKYQIIVEGDPSIELPADEQKIDQVFVNLVNNAVKYAPDSKTIHINVRQEGLFAKITVKDEGPGIAAEHLPHLFERYYRSDNHNTSGLGLGLYICAEIIRHHGGQIGVDTEPGKGSSFWFTLPLAGPL